MPVQTIEINSVKITFDKEKTKQYRTEWNEPCACQDCRNFYKNMEQNTELVAFLSSFGIEIPYAEDILSFDIEPSIRSEAYYGVFGCIEAEFSIRKYGVTVSFQNEASVPCDRTGAYFWIVVESDFPYVLDEARDVPPPFSEENRAARIFRKIETVFKKSTEK